jgi:hypothetical protein
VLRLQRQVRDVLRRFRNFLIKGWFISSRGRAAESLRTRARALIDDTLEPADRDLDMPGFLHPHQRNKPVAPDDQVSEICILKSVS